MCEALLQLQPYALLKLWAELTFADSFETWKLNTLRWWSLVKMAALLSYQT